MQRDGTFWCECEADYTDLVEDVDAAVRHFVLASVEERGEKGLRSTAPQAAKLMKQKMSGGYEWRLGFTFVKRLLPPDFTVTSGFTVTFGPDGRVKDISDVHTDDPSYPSHRPA